MCWCEREESNISSMVGLCPPGKSFQLISSSPNFLILQLLLQFPCHFEFNLTYLLKLAQHTYSNLFGNFLTNSLAERRKLKIKERTRSIWGYLRNHPTKFRNFLFVRRDEVLWPRFEVRVEKTRTRVSRILILHLIKIQVKNRFCHYIASRL